MKEFNLSDKFILTNKKKDFGFYLSKDVKEFIRLLKEELILDMDTLGRVPIGKREDIILRIIDKLAGDRLK